MSIAETSNSNIYQKILTSCVCHNTKKATRTLTNLYDRALVSTGINSGQFSILLKINALNHPTLNTLAEELNLKNSTISRALSPLERDNLIIITSGTDKRTRCVKLSEVGQLTLKKALPLWETAQKQVFRNVPTESLEQLIKNLDTLSKIEY